MAVLGIGIDLIKILRISRILTLKGDRAGRFCRRVLHQKELDVLRSLSPSASATYVAGSWAAKEALFKTIDPVDQKNFQFNQWYRTSVHQKPAIFFDGVRNDQFLLSILHDGDHLVATVLRQSSDRST